MKTWAGREPWPSRQIRLNARSHRFQRPPSEHRSAADARAGQMCAPSVAAARSGNPSAVGDCEERARIAVSANFSRCQVFLYQIIMSSFGASVFNTWTVRHALRVAEQRLAQPDPGRAQKQADRDDRDDQGVVIVAEQPLRMRERRHDEARIVSMPAFNTVLMTTTSKVSISRFSRTKSTSMSMPTGTKKTATNSIRNGSRLQCTQSVSRAELTTRPATKAPSAVERPR